MSASLKQDSVELVIEILRRAMGTKFKEYYDGDPDLIPTFNLPACVVTKTSDNQATATTRQDEVTETIVIKAILNKKDDWDAKVKPTNMTEKKLRRLMEARDSETGRYLPDTIRGAIRLGLDGERRYVGITSLELGVQLRPTALPDDPFVAAEAQLTIQLAHTIYVD